MAFKAYAKINIGLRILNKRDDGFHNIETVFHRINIFDEIKLLPSDTIVIECNNPEIPLDSSNLCYKAANILQKEFKISTGVKILLQKNIPIGAGLGGGSSDAASILKNLPKFWKIQISKERLHFLATQLGSDVPYFLDEGTAYATGRGEKLEYFPIDIPYWIVLVHPNIHVSTPWAYNHLKLKTRQEGSNFKELLTKNITSPDKMKEFIHNDFEDLVFENFPDIKKIKIKLTEMGADFVQMSGSGSSVYAFFKDKKTAKQTVKTFSPHYPAFLTEPNFKPSF
jgi:4-diphosphocytidyl-2-C-methyl-D-erythritol kinase